MLPRTQRKRAQADRGARQGVGDRGFDLFLAAWAPVAMDRVFGNFRLDLWDVFDVSGAGFRAAIQGAAAIGTDLRTMFPAMIDPLRGRSSRAFMARLGPGFSLGPDDGLLEINRDHSRWSAGLDDSFCLGRHFSKLQESENNGLFTLIKDSFSLGMVQPNQLIGVDIRQGG